MGKIKERAEKQNYKNAKHLVHPPNGVKELQAKRKAAIEKKKMAAATKTAKLMKMKKALLKHAVRVKLRNIKQHEAAARNRAKTAMKSVKKNLQAAVNKIKSKL